MTVQQPAPEHQPRQQQTGHPSGPLPKVPPIQKPSRITKAAKIGLVVLAAGLLFAGGMAVAGGSSTGPDTGASSAPAQASAPLMPDYTGWTVAAATADLAKTGRTWNLTAVQAAATVASQTPAAGTPLYPETYVTLYPTQPTYSAPTYSAPTYTEPAAIDPNAITAGTYEVGTDLQPGTYKTAGAYSCYWERLRGNSGEFSDIIANGNEPGRGSITVSKSDKFVKFSGVCTWSRR